MYNIVLKLMTIVVGFLFLLTVFDLQQSIARQLETDPDVTQVIRPLVELTDQQSIAALINEFLLPENPDEVERIEIIDVTDGGFGTDNILVAYPSANVYILDQPGDIVDDIMRGWSIEDQRRDGLNLPADYFYPDYADTLESWEIEENQAELVINSLIADVLESLNRNYDTMPVSFRFERDMEGFTFQMWDYDVDAFSFSPRPPATPDTIPVHDMLMVLYSDSTIIADTTYYDLLFFNKTIEEIVYLPGEPTEYQPFDTERLPGTLTSPAMLQNRQNQIHIEE